MKGGSKKSRRRNKAKKARTRSQTWEYAVSSRLIKAMVPTLAE